MSCRRLELARARLRPLGRLRLALPEDVGHVLRVRRESERDEPEVAVEDVPPFDHRRGHAPHVDPTPLHRDRGLEPGVETQVVHALAHPPHDIGGRGLAGDDHDLGEGRADDLVHHRLHPAVDRGHGGHPHGQVFDRQQRFAHHAACEIRAERRLHLLPFTRRQAVGEVVVVRNVDRDPPRVALAHHVGEEIPLVLAP